MKKIKSLILALILFVTSAATCFALAACDGGQGDGNSGDSAQTPPPTQTKPTTPKRKTSETDPIVGTWFCDDEKIDRLVNKPNYYSNCKLYYIISYNPDSDSDYSLTIWSRCHSKDVSDAYTNHTHTQENADMTVTVKDIEDKHYAHTGRIYFSQYPLTNTYHFIISDDEESFTIHFVNSGTVNDSIVLTFTRTQMTLDEFKTLDVND